MLFLMTGCEWMDGLMMAPDGWLRVHLHCAFKETLLLHIQIHFTEEQLPIFRDGFFSLFIQMVFISLWNLIEILERVETFDLGWYFKVGLARKTFVLIFANFIKICCKIIYFIITIKQQDKQKTFRYHNCCFCCAPFLYILAHPMWFTMIFL